MKIIDSAGLTLFAALIVVQPTVYARAAFAQQAADEALTGGMPNPVDMIGSSLLISNPVVEETSALINLQPSLDAGESVAVDPILARQRIKPFPDRREDLPELHSLRIRSPEDRLHAARESAETALGTGGPNADSESGRSGGISFFDGGIPPAGPDNADLEVSLDRERTIAMTRIFYNLTSLDGVRHGAVPASPSRRDPDYWFHWKRDAGIVMTAVARLHRASILQSRSAAAPSEKHGVDKWIGWTDGLLNHYAGFARDIQLLHTAWELGDVKMHVDGTAYTGDWMRPQNDGPAFAAISLIYFAGTLLHEGKIEAARKLYDGRIPTDSVIKADLEYVAHRWRDPDFDPWEEVLGHHFFNRMIQRKAMIDGARFARTMGDDGAAVFYGQQARLLEIEIEKHWDAQKGSIAATLDRTGGVDYKSGLDVQVVMAALYGDVGDGFFGVTDDRILATAVRIHKAFKDLYPINRNPDAPGTAMGRYPEDVYYEGNPWIIATNAFAQLHYKAGSSYLRAGAIEITPRSLPFFQSLGVKAPERLQSGLHIQAGQPLFADILAALKRTGDSYLERVRYHANPDGSLSEQIEKNSGFMLGARDLTWNYETYLTTIDERQKFVAAMTGGSIMGRK